MLSLKSGNNIFSLKYSNARHDSMELRLNITHLINMLIFLVFILLSGCRSVVIPVDPPKLPTKVDGASDQAIARFRQKIINQGGRVITMGQDYLISIPSNYLFPNQSPQLTWESYALLNSVACYLQQFRKISVYVTAYSTKYVSAPRERALTLARARTVAEYLWSQDVNTRFIFTQGLGSDKPITAHAKCVDGAPNSRIEITFRDAVA